ncbi:hypothetical protein KKB99_01620 [bacterium]|nr:hypothetical protein [bacterium]MBU1024685.1 hypothetical protein [bacterium]
MFTRRSIKAFHDAMDELQNEISGLESTIRSKALKFWTDITSGRRLKDVDC